MLLICEKDCILTFYRFHNNLHHKRIYAMQKTLNAYTCNIIKLEILYIIMHELVRFINIFHNITLI